MILIKMYTQSMTNSAGSRAWQRRKSERQRKKYSPSNITGPSVNKQELQNREINHLQWWLRERAPTHASLYRVQQAQNRLANLLALRRARRRRSRVSGNGSVSSRSRVNRSRSRSSVGNKG